jgi:hypothetical protein
MTNLQSAEQWLKDGIAPIPIRARDKRPTGSWQQYQTQLPTYQDLLTWFPADNDLNLAVVTGWQGLTVADFDSILRSHKWLLWAMKSKVTRDISNRTYRVRTARGMHVYILVKGAAPRSRLFPNLGVDVKGTGGYVVVPPSVHPSGAIYGSERPPGQPPTDKALAPRLLSEGLSDILPAAELVRAAVEDPDPDSPIRIVLPDLATVASADPWDAAARVVEFDRARGLARIKNTFRIEDWFPDRTRSSSDGRWWLARCPWHDDQNPSFWIDTTRQLCGCHAGCTPRPLDVIDVFARVCSLSNEEAIRQLSRAAGS